MILFLIGEDTYRLAQRLKALRLGFKQKYDKAGFNAEVINGDELTLENFRKAVFSSGLFSAKRLTVVKNIFNNKNEELHAQVAEELKKVGKENILIITASELPKEKNNPLLMALKKADKIEHFPLLKAGELYRYIQQEVKRKGATIESDAVNYLVEAVGDDLWWLNNELDKLTGYSQKITAKNCDLFIDSPLDENIFNLMDALSAKNAKKALSLLHDQLDSGANAFYLLTMLARQIKILLQVKESQGKNLSMHPFVVKKAMAQVNKFSMADLKKLFSQLADIDTKLKSTRLTPALLLDLFVVNMCK
ncbi:MAG: DNA polymerase III subunit delta [Patescibacteria group bacterium]|jgi:DNA polymerase-3 subunit delta